MIDWLICITSSHSSHESPHSFPPRNCRRYHSKRWRCCWCHCMKNERKCRTIFFPILSYFYISFHSYTHFVVKYKRIIISPLPSRSPSVSPAVSPHPHRWTPRPSSAHPYRWAHTVVVAWALSFVLSLLFVCFVLFCLFYFVCFILSVLFVCFVCLFCFVLSVLFCLFCLSVLFCSVCLVINWFYMCVSMWYILYSYPLFYSILFYLIILNW